MIARRRLLPALAACLALASPGGAAAKDRSEQARSLLLAAAQNLCPDAILEPEARSDEIDAILERAGILSYFADHTDQATSVPDVSSRAQPGDNRPYAVN